jgi:ABC-2 type transport system permease protein
MKKTILVARHEFLSTLKRRSAVFVLFGLPLLSMLFLAGINWLARSQTGADGPGSAASSLDRFVFGGQEEPLATGLVDLTGRVDGAHPLFLPFASVAAAQRAYDGDEIGGYYVIAADFVETGRVTYHADTFPFESSHEQILYALLAESYLGESAPVARIVRPLEAYTEVNLSTRDEPEGQTSFAGAFGLGFAIAILFYLTAMGAAGYLLQSLGHEKQNRVMEILLSSIRPFELLLGKMIGLGGIGLLQMAIWSAVALLLFRQGDAIFANIQLPTLTMQTWILIILHFAMGYLVYASLFAGLGAITPSPKESSQYTFILMLPTFLPMWFISILLSAPNSPFSLALSLIPLTAPLAMPLRLVITAIPTWQWLLSLTVSLLTAAGALWLATRIFHSRILLSGRSLTPRSLWHTLRQT